METFVIRVFVDDVAVPGGPRGLIEHAGTPGAEVFDGPEALVRVIERGLARALAARRRRGRRSTERRQP